MRLARGLLLVTSACTVPNPNAFDGEVDAGTSAGAGTDGGSDAETGPSSVCGDGEVEGEEQCDEGSGNGNDQACKSDCTPNVCGDGHAGPGEECDAGPANADGGSCTNACKAARCGDGLLGPNEACDLGEDNDDAATCKSNCQLNVCGDGATGPGEQCDDANEDEEDGCRSNCRLVESPTCGDGEADAMEWCLGPGVPSDTWLFDLFDWGVLDVDADGREDLVVVQKSPHRLRWVLGGEDVFTLGHEVDYGSAPNSPQPGPVVVADFVPGAALEVMHLTLSEGATEAELWWTASVGPELVEADPAPNPQLAGVALADAVALRFDATAPPVAAGLEPNPATSLQVVTRDGGVGSYGLETGGRLIPFDPGSGVSEVLIVARLSPVPGLDVYRSNGATLSRDQQIDYAFEPAEAVVDFASEDLDGDGIDELLALNGMPCFEPGGGCVESTLFVYPGRAEPEPLGSPLAIPVGSGAVRLAVADFNVDGAPDIAVTRTGEGDILILETDAGVGLAWPYQRRLNADFDRDSALIAGDFNGDGTPDLISHVRGEATSTVFWSQP